jgi:hypothetical protein
MLSSNNNNIQHHILECVASVQGLGDPTVPTYTYDKVMYLELAKVVEHLYMD